MDEIRPPLPLFQALFPNHSAAQQVIDRLHDAGIRGEQISVADQNSAVLSAANDPAIYRATGEGIGDEPEEDGDFLYVRTEREHLEPDGPVLVTVAPQAGQELVVQEILGAAGKRKAA